MTEKYTDLVLLVHHYTNKTAHNQQRGPRHRRNHSVECHHISAVMVSMPWSPLSLNCALFSFRTEFPLAVPLQLLLRVVINRKRRERTVLMRKSTKAVLLDLTSLLLF